MDVWITINSQLPISRIGDAARRAERCGADCIAVSDNAHDGYLAALAAIQATERIKIATMAIVAFARSPMVSAVAAWNLQEASGGRFRLGLGPLISQIMKGKYGVPWHPPAPRMRDYISSLDAIFACWRDGVPLDHRGLYYQLTKQDDYNKPAPSPFPAPPFHLGVIGPHMTALAGEVATGIMTHPTNSSPEFIRNHLIPNLRKGAERSGRSIHDVDIMVNPPLALGASTEDVERKRDFWKKLLAILYSTPNYDITLRMFGYDDLSRQLRVMIRSGHWDQLEDELDDKLVDVLVPRTDYANLPDLVRNMYKDLANVICLPLPDDEKDDPLLSNAIKEIRLI